MKKLTLADALVAASLVVAGFAVSPSLAQTSNAVGDAAGTPPAVAAPVDDDEAEAAAPAAGDIDQAPVSEAGRGGSDSKGDGEASSGAGGGSDS